MGGTGQPALDAQHAGHGEAPDVGVEHAHGQASAARAAARFTVTDDLPTPPLPEAMRITLAPSGTEVFSGAADVPAGFGHGGAALVGVISVQRSRTSRTPGRDSTRATMSCWSWAQRAPGGGEGDRDLDGAVGRDLGAAGHAQVDDVAAQLGIDHPAQDGQHILGVGRCSATAAFYRSAPVKPGGGGTLPV